MVTAWNGHLGMNNLSFHKQSHDKVSIIFIARYWKRLIFAFNFDLKWTSCSLVCIVWHLKSIYNLLCQTLRLTGFAWNLSSEKSQVEGKNCTGIEKINLGKVKSKLISAHHKVNGGDITVVTFALIANLWFFSRFASHRAVFFSLISGQTRVKK